MNAKECFEVQALIERRSIPEPNTGCWLWDAACDQDGYGRTKWKGISRPAHRLSYEAFTGHDPGQLFVLHSCDISSCVNPSHLTAGTCGDNLREAAAKGRMRRHHRSWRVAAGARSTHTFDRVTGKEITAETFRPVISYDPETGIFTWADRAGDHGWTRRNAGKPAGYVDTSNGYIRIGVFGTRFFAHRLAVLYMTGAWPTDAVDHINGNPLDNRWANLRCATKAQNEHNTGLRSNNKSGVKGVSWDKSRGRWFASITVNGKERALGRFDDIEEATKARRAAEAEHHGVFAHTQGNA